jgi:hypothetical protein
MAPFHTSLSILEHIALLRMGDEAQKTLSGLVAQNLPVGLLQLHRHALPEFGADLGIAAVSAAGEPSTPRAAIQYQVTQPVVVSIGEMCKPEPHWRRVLPASSRSTSGEQDGVRGCL